MPCIFALLLVLLEGSGGWSKVSGISRSTAQIMALSTALAAYKADNGDYPSNPAVTDQLAPNTTFDPNAYVASSAFLYRALTGEAQSSNVKLPRGSHYFHFTPEMLRVSSRGHIYIVDQWGNSYGYSTYAAKHPDHPGGNNPTFDLWSTAGGRTKAAQLGWITNW